MKRLIHILIFFIILNIQGKAQNADSVKVILLNPKEFRNAIVTGNDPLIIDVREFFEYKKSRIKHAINIPAAGNLEFSADTIDKASHLYFYCTSGFRSKRVAKYFSEKGFKSVYSLDGGITQWKKEEFPVERKRLHKK